MALLAMVVVVPAVSLNVARFPSVTADSLSKQTVHLPTDFGGMSLVLLTFDRDQQKDVDTWTGPADGLAKKRGDFHLFEIPVLPPRDAIYRWWLNTAMRSGTRDDAARSRTVPIYVDKHKFRDELQISTEKTITALLVDKSGDVLWRSSGDWTEEKQRALEFALERR